MNCPRCRGRGEVSSHGFRRHCPRCAGTGRPLRSHGFDHDGDEMLPVDGKQMPRWAEVLGWAALIGLAVAVVIATAPG